MDRARILLAACDFGWGSLGKMRLVLDKLPPADVQLYSKDHAFDRVSKGFISGRHSQLVGDPKAAHVALVINDPKLSNEISSWGVPIVYVDSLPYLWTLPDEVPDPAGVMYYCAQRYPKQSSLLPSPILDGWRQLKWVDPIVPASRYRAGGGGAVVNLGGLHSHLSGDASAAYEQLVLPPLITSLLQSGRTIIGVCGNLSTNMRTSLADMLGPLCRIGSLSPYEFEELIKTADILYTSPGSTTILQAASIHLPTVLLPPQNLSQILNSQIYGRNEVGVMTWPTEVVDLSEIDTRRSQGEDEVLSYLYQRISYASMESSLRTLVARVVVEGVARAPDDGDLDPEIRNLGNRGASQIAQVVRQAVLAPHPRPSQA